MVDKVLPVDREALAGLAARSAGPVVDREALAKVIEATFPAQLHGRRQYAMTIAQVIAAGVAMPIVDREALARQMFIADNTGVYDAAGLWDGVGNRVAQPWAYDNYRRRADALIASGIFEDRRAVAETVWDEAHDAIHRVLLQSGPIEWPVNPYREQAR